MKVRVVDADTGKPVARVNVCALCPNEPGAPGVGSGMTDGEGEYTLRLPTGSSYMYLMAAIPKGYQRADADDGDGHQTVVIKPGQKEANVTFQLQEVAVPAPGRSAEIATVRGRIVDANGKPVAGVRIGDSRVEKWDGMEMPTSDPAAGKTDAEGWYQFPAHAGIEHRVWPSEEDYDRPESRAFVPQAGKVHSVEDLVVHPRPVLGYITGRVVDPDGKPIAGAVMGYRIEANVPRSDEDGKFRMAVRQKEKAETVVISKVGYAPRTWLDVPPNGTDLQFVLRPSSGSAKSEVRDVVLEEMIGEQAPTFDVERWVFNGNPTPKPIRTDGKSTLVVFAWDCGEPARALKLIQDAEKLAGERGAAAAVDLWCALA